ncbi:MAG: polymorphic toxin-type HINT domain-containing protein, partial [Lachnospiraceae bacterium]
EAIKSGDPVEITVRFVQLICMLFGLTSQCFTGDTLVSTEYGLRPIEDIQVGDYVWSENTETGEKELKKVLSVSVTETTVLVHVYTEDGTEINTTENHPFFVEGKGWCAAAELEHGDVLHTQDGSIEIVSDVIIEQLDEAVKVYNLEIEDSHTYYVSNNGILVHNKCIKNSDGTFDIDDWSEYPEDIAHPEGPFIVLEGDDYAISRKQANRSNRKLHRMYKYLKGLEIHEVLPVKFGGNPIDVDNKVVLTKKQHSKFTVFWNKILKELGDMKDE